MNTREPGLDSFGAPQKPSVSPEVQAKADFLIALREEWKTGQRTPAQISETLYPGTAERVFPVGTRLQTWEETVAASVDARWNAFKEKRTVNPGFPRAILFAGAPGVGKTTERIRLVESLESQGEAVLVINPDAHRKDDPFYAPLLKLNYPGTVTAVGSFNIAACHLQEKAIHEPGGIVIFEPPLDNPEFADITIRDFLSAGYQTEVRALFLRDPLQAHYRAVSRAMLQTADHPDGSGVGRWISIVDSLRPDGSVQKGMLGRAKDVAIQFATTWQQIPCLTLKLYEASGPELVEIATQSREGRELLAINAALNRNATSPDDLIDPITLAKWRKDLGLEGTNVAEAIKNLELKRVKTAGNEVSGQEQAPQR